MMFDDLPLVMAKCLGLTIVMELVLALIFGVRNKKDIVTVILVQIVTNPIVVTVPYLIYLYLGYNQYLISIYVLEVLAVLVEGFIYFKTLKYRKVNPFLLALLLNLFSFFVGELINKFL